MENIHDLCRAKDYMKKFCRFLRENPMQIFNFTTINSYENEKVCYNGKENLEKKQKIL